MPTPGCVPAMTMMRGGPVMAAARASSRCHAPPRRRPRARAAAAQRPGAAGPGDDAPRCGLTPRGSDVTKTALLDQGCAAVAVAVAGRRGRRGQLGALCARAPHSAGGAVALGRSGGACAASHPQAAVPRRGAGGGRLAPRPLRPAQRRHVGRRRRLLRRRVDLPGAGSASARRQRVSLPWDARLRLHDGPRSRFGCRHGLAY